MHVFALDTTTRAGSAALVTDDRVIAARVGDPARTHAERLPGDVTAVVEEAGLTLAEIDVLAVAVGPGSFTGLRIGIATIQGLAFVLGRPVVPISALEALAAAASEDAVEGTVIAAWMDAHRREVFSAVYRVAAAHAGRPSTLVEIDGPAVQDPESVVQRWSAMGVTPAIVIGDGAIMHAAHLGADVEVIAPPPLAPVMARLAGPRVEVGAGIGPAAIQPLYVRRPDAELARERERSQA